MLDPTSLKAFAIHYTAAWCSQNAASVAEHFSEDGSLTINGGTPAKGRDAIAKAAQEFMTGFPDLQIFMDDIVRKENRVEYHWTLVGRNTGPGGTGHRVRISGYESWKFDADGLVRESQGHFDAASYKQQLEGRNG